MLPRFAIDKLYSIASKRRIIEELRTSTEWKGIDIVAPLPKTVLVDNSEILFFNTSRSNANGLTYYSATRETVSGEWFQRKGVTVDFIVVKLPEKIKTRGDAKVQIESWFGSQDVTLLKSLGNSEWQMDTLLLYNTWKDGELFDQITSYIDRSKGIGTIWTTFWKQKGNNNYPNVSFHWSIR